MSSIMDGIKIMGPKGKLPRYVAAGIIYILGVWISYIFPYRSERYLLFSIPVGILSFLSAIWQVRKPNLSVKYILQTSASALLAVLAYRSINYLFPQFSPYTEVLMIFSFVFAHTLRLWNLPAAIFIGDELYAPKTLIGKIIFRVLLVVAPFGAIGGTLLGRLPKNVPTIFIAGIICLYLAFSIPFPDLSRYSVKGSHIPSDNELENKEANLPARKSSRRRLSTNGKHNSNNKKE